MLYPKKHLFHFTLTDEEFDILHRKAENDGISLNEFIMDTFVKDGLFTKRDKPKYPKTKVHYLRVSIEEFDKLHEQARKASVSLSEFIHAMLVKQSIFPYRQKPNQVKRFNAT